MIIALQYWSGDEVQALELARLIADIEPRRRDDALLVLSRASDCAESEEAKRTRDHCSRAFQTMLMRSARHEAGYPDGSFGLWAGTMSRLHTLWQQAMVPWDMGRTVFACESDGAPLRPDWIDRIVSAHRLSRSQGKRVTGAAMDLPIPHINGNLVLDLQLLGDYPSLRECPKGVAWDLHHSTVLLREARACNVIWNAYGARDLTTGTLSAVGKESAWVHGAKDDSALRFARWAHDKIWRTK